MKTALRIAICLALVPTASQASGGASLTGAMVRELCDIDVSSVFGFVAGVETTVDYLGLMVEFKEKLSGYQGGSMDAVPTPFADLVRNQICVPPAFEIGERVSLFCRHLDQNRDAETSDLAASSAYFSAMEKVWPCESQ